MIGHIKGIVIHTGPDQVIISTGGVGYSIFITPDTMLNIEEESEFALWTHQVVRETALDLYGFPTRDELRLFELLLSVSGIGPKSALSVLTLANAETLTNAIARGDSTGLIKVSGIGKKTAEKIVLELHEKVGPITNASETDMADADTLEALTSMGYSINEAREALKLIPKNITSSNEMLREALKRLSK